MVGGEIMLSKKDKAYIHRRNSKNGYGITKKQMLYYGMMHHRSYVNSKVDGNTRGMEYVEYLLTDINFHHECGLLSSGNYEEFFKEVSAW
jgi:hypothetical protein